MINEILWGDTSLQQLVRQLDPATVEKLGKLKIEVDAGRIQRFAAKSRMREMLTGAQFTPGFPLQALGHPTTPASQEVEDLGTFGSASDARRRAAEYYSLLEAENTDAAEPEERLGHLHEQIVLCLELGTTRQFSARLPETYEPKLKLQPTLTR